MVAKHFALTTGQSNADLTTSNALANTMYNGGYTERVAAQWNKGGQEIATWVNEQGVTQVNFDSSVAALDAKIDEQLALSNTIGSVLIQWIQGERDTVKPESLVAPGNATADNYGVKLPLLVRAFQRYYLTKYQIIPEIVIVKTSYDQTHGNWNPDQLTALGAVNAAQDAVAASMIGVHKVETSHLSGRSDGVHWNDWTGGAGPQKTIGEDTLPFINVVDRAPYHSQLVGIDHS